MLDLGRVSVSGGWGGRGSWDFGVRGSSVP
jgi:hypothetical protein